MAVRVLVVDDEPDVEVLFRQQFRREVREGHYTIDFALSASLHSTSSPGRSVTRSACWCRTSTCPA